MNSDVDEYLNNVGRWQNELRLLRRLLLDCGLNEEFKWKQPCYTFKDNNVAIISDFKAYCSIGFFKGSLLKDGQGVLISPGENSQSSRQLRFTSTQQIVDQESIIKAYIFEAIEVEKAGLKVSFKKSSEYDIPEELQLVLDQDAEFRTAFEALTPGRQRGYLLHFAGAKQSETRLSRIEKYRARIMAGKGLQDCVCGHSKRMPRCDGSHKHY